MLTLLDFCLPLFSVLWLKCTRRVLSHHLLSYTWLAGTSSRLFRHRHTAQKQQRGLTGACCCHGSDSGGSDHSSFDSGHSHSSFDSGHSHASDQGSSSHGSSSHSDYGSNSDHASWSSNTSDGGHGNHRHPNKDLKDAQEGSKHGHNNSKHRHKKSSINDSADESFLSDSALDVVSMFDTTETNNNSVEYRPSSGTYSPPSPVGSRNSGEPTNSNFWAYKPAWCQPWSIISTGIAFVAGARWIAGGSTIATVVAAAPILAWWYVFLILVPGDFRKYADK